MEEMGLARQYYHLQTALVNSCVRKVIHADAAREIDLAAEAELTS